MTREDFIKLQQEFETRRFDVRIPENYNWTLPKAVRDGVIAPIYEGGSSMSSSKVTIPIIVDMMTNEVEFYIKQPKDISTILLLLQNFVEFVHQFNIVDPDVLNFMQKTLPVIEKFKRLSNIIDKEATKHGKQPTRPTSLFDRLGDFFIGGN